MRYLVALLVTLGVLWGTFVVALLLIRPRGMNLRDARAAVPDTVRLLRSLHNDHTLPAGVRRWLRALLVYLAIPIDLVPDFVPVLGHADDAILVAFVLRRVSVSRGQPLSNNIGAAAQPGLLQSRASQASAKRIRRRLVTL